MKEKQKSKYLVFYEQLRELRKPHTTLLNFPPLTLTVSQTLQLAELSCRRCRTTRDGSACLPTLVFINYILCSSSPAATEEFHKDVF